MTTLTLAKPALEDNNAVISAASTLVRSKLRHSGEERACFALVRDTVNEVIELFAIWVDDFAVLQEVGRRNSIMIRRHGEGEVSYTYNDLT